MQTESGPVQSTRSPVVDAHTHVFCWGENPKEGFLSDQTRSSRVTRLLLRVTGITREPGDTLSDKLRNRLLRELEGSSLDFAVVLAQDAVYRPDGSISRMKLVPVRRPRRNGVRLDGLGTPRLRADSGTERDRKYLTVTPNCAGESSLCNSSLRFHFQHEEECLRRTVEHRRGSAIGVRHGAVRILRRANRGQR